MTYKMSSAWSEPLGSSGLGSSHHSEMEHDAHAQHNPLAAAVKDKKNAGTVQVHAIVIWNCTRNFTCGYLNLPSLKAYSQDATSAALKNFQNT